MQRPDIRREHSARSGRSDVVPQPPVTHHATSAMGGFASVEADSADPIAQDILYRLDDHREDHARGPGNGESNGAQAKSSNARETPVPADDHLDWARSKPWWKRPSEYWLRPFAFFLAMSGGMTMSPRIELYTQLVCESVLGVDTLNDTLALGAEFSTAARWNGTEPFTSNQQLEAHQDSASIWATSPELSAQLALHPLAPLAPGPVVFLSSPRPDPESSMPHEPPRPTKECRTNPVVQSAVAQLQLRMVLAMGVLSALTTGWWGGLSDRKGRTLVLRMAVLGLMTTDAAFFAVALFRQYLPFGYNFLIIGMIVEGLVGGYSTMMAAHQAYVSDVTPSGTRARIFSLFMGIFFGGIALGPTLGGWVVGRTGSILSAFWIATAVHILYAFFVTFFLPESTSPQRREAAQAEHVAQAARRAELAGQARDSEHMAQSKASKLATLAKASPAFAFLRPLAMLLPRKIEQTTQADSQDESAEPLLTSRAGAAPEAGISHISVSHISSKRRRDWNLTLLSLSYFVELASMGILSSKVQYAQMQFNWGVQELGLFLSFASVTRVFCLTVVLPVAIKLLHRPPAAIALPQDLEGPQGSMQLDDEGRPVVGSSSSYGTMGETMSEAASMEEELDDREKSIEELWTLRAKHLRLLHDSKFDLKLARASILINALSYGLLSVSQGPGQFLAATAIASLGGGGGAAMSSLALSLLPTPTEAGKLFGSWSIMSAISTTILGPTLFALVYERTTATLPHAIFIVNTGLFLLAFAIISLVRVRKPRSLPALPPRPLSRAASAMFDPSSVRSASSSAEASTRSKVRLRPTTPFRRPGEANESTASVPSPAPARDDDK